MRRMVVSKKRVARLLLGLAVLLALWSVPTGLTLSAAYSADKTAAKELRALRMETSPKQLLSKETAATLARARSQFVRANSDLGAWYVAPLAAVPYVGRQLKAAQAQTAAASTMVDLMAALTGRTKELLASKPTTLHPKSLLAVKAISAHATVMLQRLSMGPQTGLLPSLATSRYALAHATGLFSKDLHALTALSSALTALIQHPQRYVVLVPTDTKGFVPIGVITLESTKFHLTTVTQDVNEKTTIGVPQRPTSTTFASYAAYASYAAQRVQTLTNQHVDGAIAVDATGLHQLLHLTGSLTIGPFTLTAQNLNDLLHTLPKDQHTPNAPTTSPLSELSQLQAGVRLSHVAPHPMINAHVLLWSKNEATQHAWEVLGLAGN